MGPHPEAPVDVQKYIGSCLITQQTRSKRKSCPRNQHHPKDGILCGGYMPPCNRCCNATPGYNISNYAWTGVPLISVARHSKNHHQHHHVPGHIGKNNSRMHSRKPPDYSVPLSVESPDNIEEILPISRLAIHAQGAPIILSPKDREKSCKDTDVYSNSAAPFKGQNFYMGENHPNNSNNRLYMLMSGGSEDVHLYPSTSCFIEEDLSGSNESRTVSSSPQSDCISTTSEDSGTSENGLPRIIKPRKRRKKDRRASESDSASSCSSGSSSNMEEVSGTIVTLKPYQPLCYSNGFKMYPSPPMSPKPGSSLQFSLLAGPEDDKRWRKGPYPYSPSSRCQCPLCCPPPSTFLTPPDSPVEVSEDGLAMAMMRRGKGGNRSPDNNSGWRRRRDSDFKMLTMASAEDACMDESMARSQNTLVLTSAHPPPRPWIYMTDPEPQAPCTFTVMCYNILCDKYATRQMYGYCPNWALDWTYRKKHILQELTHYKADIISLQEVETEQFYTFFLPQLQEEGYDGIFSPKSRAKTMSESERKHVDGCAIFYKTDKFTLVREHLMEFNQLAMANAEGSDDMLNRVMTKDNIGLAALLQTKAGAYSPGIDPSRTNQAIVVCTAHIHWDPEYSDVKLIQTMMLVHEIKTFVDDILQKSNVPPSQKVDPNLIPLILCGDLNSLPDSGVIEYLCSGRVSTRHCDFKEFVYNDCLSKIGHSAKATEFTHPFQMSRAYSDGIMPYTNYSYDFKGVIDYVFFSKLHMQVTGVLGPIDPGWLDENHIHGCPHPHVPSDHFPILAELKLHPTMPIQLGPPPNGVVLHR